MTMHGPRCVGPGQATPQRHPARAGAGCSLLAVLALLLLAPAASALPARGEAASTIRAPGCKPKNAKTIAVNRHVRVFSIGQYVYGCRRGAGRAFELGNALECQNNDKIDTAVVAGNFVALNVSTCSLYDSSSSIALMSLRTGRVQFRSAPLTTSSSEQGSGAIRGMVVTDDGRLAWLAVRVTRDGAVGEAEVRRRARFASTRAVLLDSGADIDPRSLRRRGSTALWRNGADQRSARLR